MKPGLVWHFFVQHWFFLGALVLLYSGLNLLSGGIWLIHMKRTLKERIRMPRKQQLAALAQVKNQGKRIGRASVIFLVGALSGWSIHTWVLEASYTKEYSAWKLRSIQYQKAYALWLERQPQPKIMEKNK